MAWLVRYRCHQCGAARDPGTETGWVRCAHCHALIAFDWQAWLASPEYRRYLSDSASGSAAAQWQRYQALLSEGDALHAQGDERSAGQRYFSAVELMSRIVPGVIPTEAAHDPTYARAVFTFNSAFLQLQRTHETLRGLDTQMQQTLRAIDFRDPLPTVLKALEMLREMVTRASALGLPPDPDGLPLSARLQVMTSQFVGGYVQMLSADQQLQLLQRVYGADSVMAVTATTADADSSDTGLGLFREWVCPACGLCSLQSRHVHEFTCMGCVFRKPLNADDDALPALALHCPTCAAPITLEAGQPERACDYCSTWVRRVRHDRRNEVDFQKEMFARVQAAAGGSIDIAPLPASGQPGLAVTPDNRDTLRLQGLARTLVGYQTLAPARAFMRLMQRTWGPADLESVLARLEAQARTDGLLASIEGTLAQLRTLAARRPTP